MRKKAKRTSIILLVVVLISSVILTSCMNMGPIRTQESGDEEEIEIFRLEIGDILQTTEATGFVESAVQNQYSFQVSGEILSALKKGDSFKEGDVLVELNNSDCLFNIEQQAKNIESIEGDLAVADSSLDTAKINYQEALDKNHFAIQLAETNTKKAEENAESALISLEKANVSADQSYESASIALENATNIAELQISKSKSALDEAERILEEAKSDPTTTPEELAQYEYNVETAEENYEITKAQQQSSIDSTQSNNESSEIQNQYSAELAESSYEQSILDQSSTYWNNLSSLYSAEAQIAQTAENIEQAEIKLQQAQIKLDLAIMDLESANEDLEDYIIVAPYDGIVLSSDFRAGEEVGGAGAISIIEDEFIIKVTISENDITRVSEGDEATVVLDSYSDLEFKGKVAEINLISTDDGGIISFDVLIEFETDEDIQLYYGLSASASIVTRKAEGVLYVPIQSVYKEDGISYVDLLITDQVDPENVSQAVKKTEITTGINDYTYIEVTSGLKEGDVIVTSRID
jgi:HlyD family secretion protein